MKSMTGYGKGRAASGGHRIQVEIKAVNHRYLDVAMRLPPFLMPYEIDIRRQLSSALERGRLDVVVTYEIEAGGTGARLNVPLAAAYVDAAAAAAARFGLQDDLTASALLAQPDVLILEPADGEGELVRALIMQAVAQALEMLVEARTLEGAQLEADMLQRLEVLAALAGRIEQRKDAVLEYYRSRLSERIRILMKGTTPDPDRLAQEVAVYADRCDVTEEIVRVRSHLIQFRQRCLADGPVGKSLDFLVQELNREFNTIGSKSQDTAVTTAVIDAKAEIEKIREQIQNVE